PSHPIDHCGRGSSRPRVVGPVLVVGAVDAEARRLERCVEGEAVCGAARSWRLVVTAAGAAAGGGDDSRPLKTMDLLEHYSESDGAFSQTRLPCSRGSHISCQDCRK